MIPPFDLFKEEDDGKVQWVEEVPSLETGKEKARERMAHSPGRYFIYSRRTGERVNVEPNDTKESTN